MRSATSKNNPSIKRISHGFSFPDDIEKKENDLGLDSSPPRPRPRPKTAIPRGDSNVGERRAIPRNPTGTRSGGNTMSYASAYSQDSPPKKRKEGGFRMTIKKLFGRKPVKSQISLPTPTKHLDNDPESFITSATTSSNYQRAVSMPTRQLSHVSQMSALGSHAPQTPSPPVIKEAESKTELSRVNTLPPNFQRPIRPRRASVPSIVMSPPDEGHVGTNQRGFQGDAASAEEFVGFAVTSGSNPKRRSKSADALFDTARMHRMSPIQWRRTQRKSDEIRYWRASTATLSTILDRRATVEEPLTDELSTNEDVANTRKETHPDAEARSIDEQEGSDNRDTFDFGLVANEMRNQEDISMEERVVTVEIKLMDLEYAISKLQARTPSPALQRQHEGTEAAQPLQPQSRDQGRDQDQDQDQLDTESDPSKSIDPSSTRPVSTTTLRPTKPTITTSSEPLPPASPTKTSKSSIARNSLTTLTIEHYTTLISLIRREQNARIHLEEQVSDLQQQIVDMRHPHGSAPASARTTSLRGRAPAAPSPGSQHGVWQDYNIYHSHPTSEERTAHLRSQSRGAVGGVGYEGSEPDEGFQDVYETPTERVEFEGRTFGSGLRGEAF
ncbi:hypothetical protein MMC09_000131 [Bachmanniomyces sp. S44760]|nr:hypothetical protein [Bachmanniomyces sp. S44760]